jgi:polyhydroxyalkanoate synthesis regulator phasin
VSAQSGQYNPQQMQNNIKTALASLVSKGTITQAQANQVVQSYAKRQPSSNHQPGSGYQQASGQRQNPILTQLVSNGTLTQTQATAVNQAISQAMPHRRPGVATSGQTSPGTTTQ